MKTKILLIIALLIALVEGARGQIYVDSYRFGGAVSNDLLLDSLSDVAVAFSLRKLDKDYTGSAIRVRRSNDNTEQDIGFVNDYLDTASLKTFVGNNNGFVVTWYNQADSAGTFGVRNATQSTSANQPQIVNSGAIQYRSGEVAINYTSSGMSLIIPNSKGTFKFLHDSTDASFAMIATQSVNAERVLFATAGSSADVGMLVYYDDSPLSNSIYFQISRGVSGTVSSIASSNANDFVANTQTLVFVRIDANNATAANRTIFNINNGSDIKNNTLTNSVSNANSALDLTIGSSIFGTPNYTFQELIIFSKDKNNDKTLIQNNINKFYSIY